MNNTKLLKSGFRRERTSRPISRTEKLALAICLLVASNSARAGYIVDSHIEAAAGTNYYTWTVYNQDQSWGLDGFAIEVPVETRILAHSVPEPYSNPDRTARWIMEEQHEGQVDAHDGKLNVPAPRAGMKWLLWWGVESPSVYPPGTTVSFSAATDSSVGPGVVKTSAATYTPQNNPHYYVSWQGQVLGPSIGVADASPPAVTRSGPRIALPDVRTALVTNLESGAVNHEASMLTPLPAASIAMHAGITVEGVVGRQYGVQFNTDLRDTTGWRGLANVMLTTPKQVWYDPRPGSGTQGFYRIVPGPIPIP